jgi:hypothetical protein
MKMKVAGLVLLLAVLLAACSKTEAPTGELNATAIVAPQIVPGNPTCQDLGYAYQFKPQQAGGGDATGNGTYVNSDGVTITITGVGGTATPPFNWSATLDGEAFGIDAVISKGGPQANVYRYSPEASSDTGLVTPNNASGNPAGISHFSFC